MPKGRPVRRPDHLACGTCGKWANRRPSRLSEPERAHAHREGKLGLGGVLSSLPVLWVNHPNRLADALYKPMQLVVSEGHSRR